MTPKEYIKWYYQQYLEDKAPEVKCTNCHLVIKPKAFGECDVVVDEDLASFHPECCPCQWLEPYRPDTIRMGVVIVEGSRDGEFMGDLWLCSLCDRVTDDSGNEVHL